MERGIEKVEYWNFEGHHITGFKVWNGINHRQALPKINYLKTGDFNKDDYYETKELMIKYKLGSVELSKKIKDAGFEKFTCYGKKWVLKEFEKHLK